MKTIGYLPTQPVRIDGRQTTIAAWLASPNCPITEQELRLRISAGMPLAEALTRSRKLRRHAGAASKSNPRKKHSRFRGVSWCETHQAWKVRVFINTRKVHQEYVSGDEMEAAIAYNRAARKAGAKWKLNVV